MICGECEPLAGWKGVEDAVTDIRSSCAEVERFFEQLFGQLESLADSLAAREAQLRQSRVAGNDALADSETAANAVSVTALQQLVEHTQQQNQQLLRSQQQFEEQLARLATMAAELAELKAIWRQAQPLAETVRDDCQESYREQLRQMAEQQLLLERERIELQSELETARGQVAELAEQLAEQKRLAALQQAQWNEELKRIRLLLESSARGVGPLVERQTTMRKTAGAAEQQGVREPQQPAAAAAEPAAAPQGRPRDVVLDSVLAQFEILQKDIARRRAGR
mgnify:CR=1 FL=1